jgi:ABC-2 type transport system permease protein
MIPLLQTELRKVLPYRTFWMILILFMGLLLLIFYAASGFTINAQQVGADFYSFPGIWRRLTYFASYFNLLLSILLLILITDEYAFRTLRQQIIDGRTRAEAVMAKFWLILVLALGATFFLLLLGLGFGLANTAGVRFLAVVQEIHFLGYYLVQAVGYMSLALLIGHLVRKSGMGILSFLVYTWVLEPLLHTRMPDELDRYFPVKVFGSLTPMPQREMLELFTGPSRALPPELAVLPALLYSGLFCLLAYGLLRVRDL